MVRGLADICVIGKAGTGHLIVNSEKLSKLSDEEFKRLLDEDARIFIDEEVLMRSEEPRCNKCYDRVKTPGDLVRYFGFNLHSSCFFGLYEKARENLPENERAYFDRIVVARSTPVGMH